MLISILLQTLVASLVLLSFSLQAAAQDRKNHAQTISNDQIVEQINRESAKLRKTTFDSSKPAAKTLPIRYREIGRVLKFVVYRDQSQIRKIVASAETVDRTATIELYYDNEQLIYAYDRMLIRDETTKVVTQKIRDEYEFKNGELISVYSGKVFFGGDRQNKYFVRLRDDIAQLSQSLLEVAVRDQSAPNK